MNLTNKQNTCDDIPELLNYLESSSTSRLSKFKPILAYQLLIVNIMLLLTNLLKNFIATHQSLKADKSKHYKTFMGCCVGLVLNSNEYFVSVSSQLISLQTSPRVTRSLFSTA